MFDSLLCSTATIYRPTTTTDDLGFTTDSLSATGNGTFRCRLELAKPNTQRIFDSTMGTERVQISTHRLFCAASVDIRTTDTLKIDGSNDEYEVLFPNPIYGAIGLHHLEVELRLRVPNR